MEKRAILGFILQNPTVSGKKLEFTMRKPLNTVLELADCPIRLRSVNNAKTIFERQNQYNYNPRFERIRQRINLPHTATHYI